LQGIIGGALTGFSQGDFRFVTMGIRGGYDALRFENIRVQGEDQRYETAIPKMLSDPKDDNRGATFKFKFEIPVGPGTSRNRGIEDQARGQILQNALEHLLQNADF